MTDDSRHDNTVKRCCITINAIILKHLSWTQVQPVMIKLSYLPPRARCVATL